MTVTVEDEIIADFYFSTETEVDALTTFESIQVPPQLGLGDVYPMTSDRGVVPTVDESREGEQAMSHLNTPHSGGLKTAERTVPSILTLEIVLVESLYDNVLEKSALAQFQAGPARNACW